MKNTSFVPPIEDVFGIFKRIKLEDVKVVMIGDKPYTNYLEVCDVAFATGRSRNTTLLLNRIFENLEKKVKDFKQRPSNDLIEWTNKGIFLCNFCFTRSLTDPLPYHYYLLWEPFINNLVQYISLHRKVVFILFGERAKSLRKSIDEINSSVVEAPHPIDNYNEFKKSNCFVEARNLACELGFTFEY